MLNKLDNETKNMMFEPGERNGTVKQIEDRITINESSGLTLLIEDGCNIGGFLTAQRGMANRIRHSAYIVVGMLTEYRGRKFGTNLFKELEKWAKENHITRLELTVIKNNECAINLYKKMGFKIEGTKENSMIIDGTYVDEYYMAKLI